MNRRPVLARILALAQITLAAAILLWPLAIAGRPTLLADTTGYWRQGRTIVVQGLGLDRNAPNPFDLMLDAQIFDHRVTPDPRMASSFLAARSPLYGVFLYASQRLGTLWLTAGLQALIAAAVIFTLWRAAAPKAARWTYLALIGCLAALSSLPFYAGFATPDVFAGLDILIIVALGLYWDRLGAGARFALWTLLALSLGFHVSMLVIVAALVPVLALILWRSGASRHAIAVRTGACAAAVAAAAALGAAATSAASAIDGAPLHNPPFLSARLLADGPGRRYLEAACAHAQPFALCAFKDRPLATSDEILWWNYADRGVFMTSGLSERLALEREEPRFVRAVIAADPTGVAGAAFHDFALQLGRFYVDDPLHDPCETRRLWYWNLSSARVLIPGADSCPTNASLYLAAGPLFGLHGAALLGSAAALTLTTRRRGRSITRPLPDDLDDQGRILAAAALIGAALVINAAVCGVLSGPFARYEARMIWLVPMAAVLGLIAAPLRAPAPGPGLASARRHAGAV
jgi:hypothetical protein